MSYPARAEGLVNSIIIIIIMLCRQHGYPWPSLATSPYRSSLLEGLQSYIPYPHITAVCMFELVVLLLLGHIWGSIGVHHLWARPCFFSKTGSNLAEKDSISFLYFFHFTKTPDFVTRVKIEQTFRVHGLLKKLFQR